LLWFPFLIAPFSSKAIDKFNSDLNSSFWYVYSNDRNDLYHLKINESICQIFTNPYDNLKFISMRVDSIPRDLVGELYFSYFLGEQVFSLSNKYFDNKSIYLDLPKAAKKDQVVQFCIQNSSLNPVSLFMKNKNSPFVLSNDLKSFNDKNFPLYLYFKKS
jgi:hypothetical protein